MWLWFRYLHVEHFERMLGYCKIHCSMYGENITLFIFILYAFGLQRDMFTWMNPTEHAWKLNSTWIMAGKTGQAPGKFLYFRKYVQCPSQQLRFLLQCEYTTTLMVFIHAKDMSEIESLAINTIQPQIFLGMTKIPAKQSLELVGFPLTAPVLLYKRGCLALNCIHANCPVTSWLGWH